MRVANLWTNVLEGQKAYDSGKMQLDMAIRDYYQTVMHFIAQVVAGKFAGPTNMLTQGTKHYADISIRQKQDEEFLQWLSPSYWLVESKLYGVREKRSKGSLKWAHDMIEFRSWRLAELHESSRDRILWIKGPLGIGKSTMAGYFIDILKCLHPKSIVAYFFCRSGEAGLMRAHDIIRTLAYQCIEDNTPGREVLEGLKRKNFEISEGLGVAYLFEKLLLDVLRVTQKEVYIILDGLDEADSKTADKSDRWETPELHVLFRCLPKLPSTRLLFISRPSADISSVLPDITIKPIGTENAQDISAYVRDFVDKSKLLRTHFKKANLNAVKYFEEKANGVFLWVVLVLQKLGQAKSASIFQKWLKDFSQASGSMDDFYTTILSQIGEEYQKWVKEIIQWLVVAEGRVSVQELRDGVEWCLQDTLFDFQKFLEMDCGSMLQSVPNLRQGDTGDTGDTVQLIHETFRSFLLNSKYCPQMFLIDEIRAHGHLALNAMRRLSSCNILTINRYWFTHWVDHLSKATSPGQSEEILIALHQLFTSDGVKNWIKHGLQSPVDIQSQDPVEEKPLNSIYHWLRECPARKWQQDPAKADGQAEVEQLEPWVSWHRSVLDNRSILGESVGKAAANIWLYDSLANYAAVQVSFLISLRYYWKRENKTQNNLNELTQLTVTEFRDIVVWAGSNKAVVKRNIGVAYFMVYRWDDCIRCLQEELHTTNDLDFRYCLGMVFLVNGDYQRAIEAMQVSVDQYKSSPRLSYCFLAACRAKGNYDEVIKTIRAATEQSRCNSAPWVWKVLSSAYEESGDFSSTISVIKAMPEMDPSDGFIWWQLWNAYIKSGDIGGAIQTFHMAIEKYPTETHLWQWLWTAYKEKGDYDGAIRAFESSIDQRVEVASYLAKARIAKGDYDGAIKVLSTAIGKDEKNIYEIKNTLYLACEKKGDYKDAIKSLEQAIEEHPSGLYLWEVLADLYMAKGDYDAAIKAYREAADQDSSELLEKLFGAYKAKGDYDGALKVFETVVHKVERFQNFWQSALLEVYHKKGDHDGAIKAFEAIVKGPKHSAEWTWAWSGLFEAFISKGDYDGAIKRFETAIAENPYPPPSWMEYVILDAYRAKGDLDGAIKRLETVVGERPLESWSWNALGDAYTFKGDLDKAVNIYQSARGLIPFDYSFLIHLGDAYHAKLNYEAALDYYKRAIDEAYSRSFNYGNNEARTDQSILYAYLAIRPSWRPSWDFDTPIDDSLSRHFLWNSLGKVYEATGAKDAAVNVYDTAITGCKSALGKEYNNLLWVYDTSFVREVEFDIFICYESLPGKVIWSELGELYKAKHDSANALEAFKKALEMESDNSWLQSVVHELEMSFKS